LSCQVAEEHNWYQELTGGSEILDPTTLITKFSSREDLFRLWKRNCFLLRQHAACLTDDDFYARIPGRQEAVREVYLHLMDFGAEQGAEIRCRLQDFGVSVEEQTVINFFYDEIKHHYSNP
jgi:hypothetical protein